MKDVLVHYTDEQVEEKIVEILTPIVELMDSSPSFKEAFRHWLVDIVEENNTEAASKLAAGIIANAIIGEMEEEVGDRLNIPRTDNTIHWEQLPGNGFNPSWQYANIHPCSGCSLYTKILRGEFVVCHCTVPYTSGRFTTGNPLVNVGTNSDYINIINAPSATNKKD